MKVDHFSEYDYFLFDWDGCLARTLHVALKAHRDSYADFGAYPTDVEIVSQFGNAQAPLHFGIEDVEGCMGSFFEYLSKGTKQVELYEGARHVLEQARRQGKVAVVSSQKRDILDYGLERHGLDTFFDLVLSADDVSERKPHPEGIEKALRHLGGTKDRAIMFGDSDKDVRAAHNAGIDSVLIYPDEHAMFYSLDDLLSHKPTHVAKGMHTIV